MEEAASASTGIHLDLGFRMFLKQVLRLGLASHAKLRDNVWDIGLFSCYAEKLHLKGSIRDRLYRTELD